MDYSEYFRRADVISKRETQALKSLANALLSNGIADITNGTRRCTETLIANHQRAVAELAALVEEYHHA